MCSLMAVVFSELYLLSLRVLYEIPKCSHILTKWCRFVRKIVKTLKGLDYLLQNMLRFVEISSVLCVYNKQVYYMG